MPTIEIISVNANRKILRQFEITSIQNSITNEIKENKKIRLLVIDTYGNKYYSKKSRYGSFNNNVITSNMINSKRH